jgi:hypothetical protein
LSFSRFDADVLSAHGAPQFEASHPAEREQRLTEDARRAMHKDALSSLNTGSAVEELVCGRPAQDQRGRLRRVDAYRHTGQAASAEWNRLA